MAEAAEGKPLPGIERALQSIISGSYISYEEQLLLLSKNPGAIDQVRQLLDQTLKTSEKRVFKHVPEEDKRRLLRETALNAARDFWTEKLKDSGLPTTTVMFGRERLTEITQRLEQLNKPPQNPQ